MIILLFGIFGILIATVIPGALATCRGLIVASTVATDDTVFAVELDKCQGTSFISPINVVRVNDIKVYTPDCSKVTTYSKLVEYASPNYTNLESQSVTEKISNYYVKGTSVRITAAIESSNVTAAILCFFDNKNYYDQFKFPNKSSNFLDIIRQGTCKKFEDSHLTFTFNVSSTGYYFGGIASLVTIDLLQFNRSLTRVYYNNSDFDDDLLKLCSLTSLTHNQPCVVHKKLNNICIMLHAVPTDTIGSDSIEIKSSPQQFYKSLQIAFAVIGSTFIAMTVVVSILCRLRSKLCVCHS